MADSRSTYGKVLHSQAREVVANVLKFMKMEAELGSPIIPIKNYMQRTIACTKISHNTYAHIRRESENEGDDEHAGTSFSTPHKLRPRVSPKSTLLIGQAETMRQIVHDFYIIEKWRPSLKGILTKVQVVTKVEWKPWRTTTKDF